MTRRLKNVADSVRARLLTLARQRGDDFQLLLVRYVNERLLYRLSMSDHATSYILKGAALFTAWNGNPHRATRDLDFHGKDEATAAAVRVRFEEILQTQVDDDGVEFELHSMKVEAIRETQEYGGVRVSLGARVGVARVAVQLDVGFGDAITPGPEQLLFPTLLEFPEPKLRAYPKATVVAEKTHALVELGLANTRLKDFYDLRVLSTLFDFDGSLLQRALRATFARRGTPFPVGRPVAFSPEFFADVSRARQWVAFAKRTGARDAGTLEAAIGLVAAFVAATLRAAGKASPFSRTWKAGGPWR